MAHHGYLELEGGQQMIEFIVRQCALKEDPPVSIFSRVATKLQSAYVLAKGGHMLPYLR